MFGWLKDKISKVTTTGAGEALRKEFARLNDVPGSPPRLADRLVDYVITGEDESVVAEVVALKNTHHFLPLFSTHKRRLEKMGLPTLLQHLPQDPKILLRVRFRQLTRQQLAQLPTIRSKKNQKPST